MVKSLLDIQNEIQSLSPFASKVKLLAVSKKQSPEKIINLYNQGQTSFGENYVQEALEKIATIQLPIKWHFIGHLQSNKVKDVVGKFVLIHSVDSLKLAQMINKKSHDLNIKQNILIEVNIGSEESKAGFSIAELLKCWQELVTLENICIQGFMCLPPLEEDDSITASYFKKMHQLALDLKARTPLDKHPLTELSMGTSGDYPIALKNNATIIRLGTILFGERN